MTKNQFITYLLLLVFVFNCCSSNNSESGRGSVKTSENSVSEGILSANEADKTFSEEINYKSIKDSVLNLFRDNRNKTNYGINRGVFGIRVGKLFDKEQKHALLAYFTSDTSGTVTIYKYRNNQWNELYKYPGLSMYVHPPLLDFSEIRFEDFNGDNKKDVLIPSSYSGSGENREYNLFLYKDSLNTFKMVEGFNELSRPEFDQETQTVHAIHGGAYGDYIRTEYKWQNDQLSMTKKTEYWHQDTVIQKIVYNYQHGGKKVNNTDTITIDADSGKTNTFQGYSR